MWHGQTNLNDYQCRAVDNSRNQNSLAVNTRWLMDWVDMAFLAVKLKNINNDFAF
jgi:hypothetical protein